jgi:hypothetical protein
MGYQKHCDLSSAVKSEQQQEEIAPDVAYEWEMLSWTSETLCRETDGRVLSEAAIPFPAVLSYGTSPDAQEASAMLEPFLLHARNVREFLYCDSSRQDDVLAVHFFDKPSDWTAKRPTLGNYLESVRRRLNKAVAHLSYARLNYRSDEGWNVKQIKADLKKPWTAFKRALSPEKRKWFEVQGGA